MGAAEIRPARGGVYGWPRWLRITLAVAGTIGAIAASGVIAYRVLAPAEVLNPAADAHPPEPETAPPGVIGTFSAAPLIVDKRLRVYAATRQVRADFPIDAQTQFSPYWSYRRWPAKVAGLVAAGPTVVSRWSDGELVALDGRTGRIAWRAAGLRPDNPQYAARRAGADIVYAPAGLYTATAAGRPVVLARASSGLRGYDLATGRELWRVGFDGSPCRRDDFTTVGGRFVTVNTCGPSPAVEFYDASTGRLDLRWRPDGVGRSLGLDPVGCAGGRSACAALRTNNNGQTRGWLVDGPEPVAAPPLDPPQSWLIGDVAVELAGGGAKLTARSVRTGAELWRWRAGGAAGRGPVTVLATQPGRIHLLTASRVLLTLNTAGGAQLSRFLLTRGRERTTWSPGLVDARDGFVAVERLPAPIAPSAEDPQQFLATQPVILAAT